MVRDTPPGQEETSRKRKRTQSINGIGRQSANKAIKLKADQKRGSLALRHSEQNGHLYRQEPAPTTRGEYKNTLFLQLAGQGATGSDDADTRCKSSA